MRKILIVFMVLFVGFSFLEFKGISAEENIVMVSDDEKMSNEKVEENGGDMYENGDYHTVFYEFIESMGNGVGYLPNEVYDLLPDETKIKDSEYPDFPELSITSIDDYVFLGWNTPVLEVTTGDIVIQGVWVNEKGSFTGKGLLRAATTSGLGSSWSYVRQDGTGGYSRYQYTINGSPAWCVEPEVTGWPLAGTRYEEDGTMSNKMARIIGMGVMNGMSAGAIQAALDNYAGHSATSSDGLPTDPYSSVYSANGSYACTIDVYSPVGNEGVIQRLGSNPRCIPLNPTVSVHKTSSSSFDYAGNCSGIYSLAGAVYGVYRDLDCTDEVTTLVTGTNGDSPAKELPSGTYYVKEKSPSKGFKIDDKIYTVILSPGNSRTVTSLEDPYDDPTVLKLTKKSSNQSGYVKYLDTAEFTVSYFDTYTYSSSLSPKLSWIFKPIIKNGEAIVEFDREHYISGPDLFDENDQLKIPLGTFTIEETKAPQTYLRDPNVYVGRVYLEDTQVKVEINGGVDLKVENEQLTQDEKALIIKTSATFKENGTDTYPADGFANIVDNVLFDNLDPEKEYLLKTKLIDRIKKEFYFDDTDYENGLCEEEEIGTVKEIEYSEGSVLGEYETLFTPDDVRGTVKTVYEIDLDEYPDHDFVVYEYLYESEYPDVLLTYHEDLYDEGQSVHITKLYDVQFVLYKVSNMSKDIKLSGAYFDVSSRRVKRDGRVTEKELGRYVTGGIYYEDEIPFTITVSDDETMSENITVYSSTYDERFELETVVVLGLDDGEYYVRKNGETEIRKWIIEQGMIYLDRQLEDTDLIFKELIAPVGYYLDSNEYIVNVGHDTTLDRVENFRINALIIPYRAPKTGID